MPETRIRRSTGQEGGLLIVLMVGVAVMFIGVSIAMQAWSVTWRRDSEEELIFRGGQYVDAILAYRKDNNGQFPTNLDDLMKIGPRQVRYIRRLYRDPVNREGQWGLLYLMPAGNAIYDPVAAQRAAEAPPDEGMDLGAGGTVPGTTSGLTGGITPINMDPMGTGAPVAGGIGQLMAPGQGGAPGTALRGPGGQPGAVPGTGVAGGGLAGGLRGGAAAGALRGGFAGGAAAAFAGGVLPPPKPKSSSFDEESASEPPIGWPIVGVISRASEEIADGTFKVYKGHEKVNEWQFHVFDRTIDQAQAPMGTVPGGSPPPFIGPGFGGKGNINYVPGAGGPRPGGGRQQRSPGQGGGRQWPAPPPPGGR